MSKKDDLDEMEISDKVKIERLRQWKQVVSAYPLVAASLMMQDKGFAKAASRHFSSASLDCISIKDQADLLAAGFGDSATAVSVTERFVRAFKDLYRDLGRATSDEETRAAFQRFGSRWRGEEETVRPQRECPNCKGTGKIDSEVCPRCRGTGKIW